MHKPSQLHRFLQEKQVSPCSALSQNFLICGNTISRMLDAAGCKTGDLVLEIGAGPGALTEGLLKAGMRVLAIEKDPIFARELSRLDREGEQLTCFAADALDLDFEKELSCRLKPGEKAYVVANLPYHLTTPLLMKLLPLQKQVQKLTLMVQKEMAERAVAPVQSQRYGWLAPYIQFFGTPKVLFSVPKQLFFPKPAVDSVILQVLLHEPVLKPAKSSRFLHFLLAAFSSPRKMVRSRFVPHVSKEKVEEALVKSGSLKTARPEEISYEQWLHLFDLLDPVLSDFDADFSFRQHEPL